MYEVLLTSKLYGHTREIFVHGELAYFAGIAYGDGYAEYGELRIATSDGEYKDVLENLVTSIAKRFRASFGTYGRTSTISGKPLWDVVLNSTLLRRALFTDEGELNYETIRLIAFNDALAPYFQAGLTDAEGTLIPPEPIEYPHGWDVRGRKY
ncbi:MAG: hypothetical protein ACUVTD_00270 [Nitrososphaerales archaeon]